MTTDVASLLHQRTGPLTRELLLEPGGFGLGRLPTLRKPEAITTTVCGYCSTGCSLDVHLQKGEAVGLTPTTAYPVNLGMACPKGWEALTVLGADDRATTPLLRNPAGRLEPVDWNTALETFVSRFRRIQAQHGNESVAFLSTGQIPTEEMALLGALAKFGMGMLHGDGNTRQCMATSVVAYKQAFGFDAPPYTYADFEESDAIILVGSNLCLAHPILWERVARNRRNPEIIVIDPRMTETAMQATQHLPLYPKSDLVLFYGIARILIQNGWIDREYIEAHTNGFDAYSGYVQKYTLDVVAHETRLEPQAIERLARTIHERERVSFWWTMGVNQSYQGVRTAQAIINLALMTGNIGRPGTGANSITGQCNAMGSRLFSNTSSLLGGRDFANEAHRNEVAGILGIDARQIPSQAGYSYPEIMDGILRGKIKGLWVICTNPAHSWINQSQCHDILDRLDFLVVQDMYHSTETAHRAHLVLPAAAWGEKEGTVINSERRIGVVKKVSRAPGQALSDFSIFRLVADAWGCGRMFARWDSPAAVFDIMKELSRGTPCDFSGIDDYRLVEQQGGIQWPFGRDEGRGSRVKGQTKDLEGAFQESTATQISSLALDPRPSSLDTLPRQERRLFEDGRYFHADGRARFLSEDPRPLSEPLSERYPFILLTGRGTASQWHTQTRTKKSAVLRKLYPEQPYVEINPADAQQLGLGPQSWVTVESQRGRLKARIFVTHAVKQGQVFVPMHYEAANQLTDAVFDPYSKQPSYKSCAVRLVP
jgi:assimilatory nitrate reductase catalytic subunit